MRYPLLAFGIARNLRGGNDVRSWEMIYRGLVLSVLLVAACQDRPERPELSEREQHLRALRKQRLQREKDRFESLEAQRKDRGRVDAGPTQVVVIPMDAPDAGPDSDAGDATDMVSRPEPTEGVPAREPWDGKPDLEQPAAADYPTWQGRRKEERDRLAPVINASNAFGLELFPRLFAIGENGALAPLHLWTALQTLATGAEDEAAKALRRALHIAFDEKTLDGGLEPLRQELHAALTRSRLLGRAEAALFLRKGLVAAPPLQERLRRRRAFALEHADFSGSPEGARKTITRWVAAQGTATRTLVNRGEVFADTQGLFVAVQALGDVLGRHFHLSQTRPGTFYLQGCRMAQVPTMRADALDAAFAKDEQVSVLDLSLPGDLSLLLVWPRFADGFPALREQVGAAKLRWWIGMLQKQRVKLLLPKLEVQARVRLDGALRTLGADALLANEAKFPGIAPGLGTLQGLWLGADLAATEKAPHPPPRFAPSRRGWGSPSLPSYQGGYAHTVGVDQPFLLFLRHRPSGTLLFIAQVANPRPGAHTEPYHCPGQSLGLGRHPHHPYGDPRAYFLKRFAEHITLVGDREQEDIQSVVKKHDTAILACLDRGWKAKPALKDSAQLSFTIQMDGRVTDVAVTFPRRRHGPTEACLVKEVKRWSFPRGGRESNMVGVPLPGPQGVLPLSSGGHFRHSPR